MKIPPPLMTSEPGSFAEYTIRSRKPVILDDIQKYNDYTPAVRRRLEDFRQEMASGAPVQSLAATADAPTDEDVAFWRAALAPWAGCSWFELPWFLAETYFYRRTLDIVGYFRPGDGHLRDPFAAQKEQALRDGLSALRRFTPQTNALATTQERLSAWLRRALWGNRADLSNIGTRDRVDEDDALRSGHILVDHGERLWGALSAGAVQRLDLVTDNAGAELLADLGLIDQLLSRNLVSAVHIHLKRQPYFVSDAMVADLERTLSALRSEADGGLAPLGDRLARYAGEGRLTWEAHPFWTTCLHDPQLPPDLRSRLAEADLLVLKGDVNYRRLVSDAHWPPTARLEEIAAYMPAPFVTVRTLKAEVIVGLAPGQAEELTRRDPQWLINGDWGVIHLVEETATASLNRAGPKKGAHP